MLPGLRSGTKREMTRLHIAIAAALLASAAHAQVEMESWWLQTYAEGAVIHGPDKNEGVPLLEEENFAVPNPCPEGSYYRSGENTVTQCGDAGASFGLAEPDAGSMMPTGDPYPEGAMLLWPKPKPKPPTDDPGPNRAPPDRVAPQDTQP